MSGPRIVAAVLLPAMVGGAVALGLATGTAIDALFLGVVAAVLFAAGAVAIRSLRAAGRAGRTARDAIATPDDELIARSVAVESARLTGDIEARLRACLGEVSLAAAAAEADGGDPRAAARRIHLVSREATAELRRQLGLLREEEAAREGRPAAEGESRAPRLRTADAVIAASTVTLSVVESVAYPEVGGPVTWPSVAATALAAATLLWWRQATGAAALACGAVWLAASLAGHPVHGGFWVMVALGLFGFRLAVRGTTWLDLAGGMGLTAGVVSASAMSDPDNAGVNTAVLVLAGATGGIVRLAQAMSRAAHRAQQQRAADVEPAVRAAVAERRATLARELHDTVSHAVGVIAVQAAAAEVSWPDHPQRAREALAACGETASAALAELEAVGAGEAAGASAADLVERFRAAGLDVRWDAASAGFVTAELEPLVGRIVQESLTNVLRHSGGRDVRVEIEPVGSSLRVVVDDDGAAGETATPPGFGLVGLRERVELVGGRFDAGPKTGGGFRVEASLPRGRGAA